MKRTVRISPVSFVSRLASVKCGFAFLLIVSILYLTPSHCTAHGEEILLGRQSQVIFANQAMGCELLGKRDAFVAALSPFDRAARLKSDKPVSEEQFLNFV